MDDNLNSVKMGSAYHHGELRKALLDSALAVLTEKGTQGFSLREAARRAGVSPAAPKHHFADARGLLTALATIAFGNLADALRLGGQSACDHGNDRLVGQGLAYVGFALANPALFELMWRTGSLDMRDAALLSAKQSAFAILDQAVRGPDAPPAALHAPEMTRTMAHWSVVHGLAGLALDGVFGAREEAAQPLRETVTAILSLLRGRAP